MLTYLQIKGHVIKAYLYAASLGWAFVACLGILLNVGGQVGNNIWLSEWSNDGLKNISEAAKLTDMRLGVYAGLGIVQCTLPQQ